MTNRWGKHGNSERLYSLGLLWTEKPGELQSMGSQRVRQDAIDLRPYLPFLLFGIFPLRSSHDDLLIIVFQHKSHLRASLLQRWQTLSYTFFKGILFAYLCLCCIFVAVCRLFSSWEEQAAYSLVAVCRLLIEAASLVAKHRL